MSLSTVHNVRWGLRETEAVEGIRECEGGQGGQTEIKCSGKALLKKISEQRLEGGEVVNPVGRKNF